jgi:hypothetical protein
MYALSHAIIVNPAGAFPVLNRQQVWRGLVMKAENAVPFVPGMEACVVVARHDKGLLRDVTIRGESLREKISFTPEVQVLFERIDSPGGWITNVISDSDQGLLLTFTFAVRFPGLQEGSPEEHAKGEEMKGSYVAAVAATLDRVRAMVSAGELA